MLDSQEGSSLTSLHGLHGIFDLEDVPIGAGGDVMSKRRAKGAGHSES
jgi:hypothetical protein